MAGGRMTLRQGIARHCWRREGSWGDRRCERLAELRHCRHCPVFRAAGREVLDRPLDEAEVQRRTEEVARPRVSDLRGEAALLVFRLGPEWFALDVHVCRRVYPMATPQRVPLVAGELVLGLVNLERTPCVCVDLAVLLGLGVERADAAQRRLVRLAAGLSDMAFVADELAGVFRLHMGGLEGLPDTLSDAQRQWLRGTFHWRSRHVALLDQTRLLNALRDWRS